MVNAAVPVDIRDRLMKDTSFWVPLATIKLWYKEEHKFPLYEQSADELAACFKTMEIQYDVDHREKLKQAQNKDSVRVTEVNEKLNQYERPSTVEVAVDVYENNQNGKK
ncbi:hypothetical protein RSAG8_11468, partial [Rhizoctonia solani AG-8 WAC10335]